MTSCIEILEEKNGGENIYLSQLLPIFCLIFVQLQILFLPKISFLVYFLAKMWWYGVGGGGDGGSMVVG